MKQDRTYVITIGTGCKDLRNNAMMKSYTVAFSTGKKLDTCGISGQLFAEGPVEGTQVWAYLMQENKDPNPQEQFADYITQADKSGQYRFYYLAQGRYRLFAVNDRDVNQLYDPEYDLLGVTNRDAELFKDSVLVQGINFRITMRDTTPPVLLSASAPDKHHIDLGFSEPLMKKGVENIANYRIVFETDTCEILTAYQNLRNPAFVHLLTESQDSVNYQVFAQNLFDLWEHPVEASEPPVVLEGNANSDTTRPRLIFTDPPDSSFFIPTTTQIQLAFSEPMDTSSVMNSFALYDSSENIISGKWQWDHPVKSLFILILIN
jgi:hypothetical protein